MFGGWKKKFGVALAARTGLGGAALKQSRRRRENASSFHVSPFLHGETREREAKRRNNSHHHHHHDNKRKRQRGAVGAWLLLLLLCLAGWLTGITMPTDGTMQSNIMSSTRNVSFLEDDASRWWRTAFQSAEAFLARRIMRRFFTV